MKICVFFHAFEPIHENKDPEQILLGLRDIGFKSEMVTYQKPVLDRYNKFPIRKITPQQAHDVNFWRSTEYDAVIAYTWLRNDLLWVLRVLKEAGKKVIAKADTDGRYSFPVYPRWDTYIKKSLNILDYLKIARRRFKRRFNAKKYIDYLAEHLTLADYIIVETPQAQANLAYFLSYWKNPDLIKKLFVIPNPVADDAMNSTIPERKQNRITAIGNWQIKFGSYYAKNTAMMITSICNFLSKRTDYHAEILGDGADIIRDIIKKRNLKETRRLDIAGSVGHQKVINSLAESQVFFMPSTFEGLSIAASEAVCMGCSIVGSPLECLRYLSQEGSNGTLAADFREEAYLGALIADVLKWERGIYSAKNISSIWRNRLKKLEIARQYKDLIKSI